MDSTGTTPHCAYCGRPIINHPTRFGYGGEPYHVECTLPPLPKRCNCPMCSGEQPTNTDPFHG